MQGIFSHRKTGQVETIASTVDPDRNNAEMLRSYRQMLLGPGGEINVPILRTRSQHGEHPKNSAYLQGRS